MRFLVIDAKPDNDIVKKRDIAEGYTAIFEVFGSIELQLVFSSLEVCLFQQWLVGSPVMIGRHGDDVLKGISVYTE
ncbi:hypothetical protein RN22_17910 [Grimontia sp. AD028]|nr:hypothetical protein RN22_17910 [Grimontia sp. AD028]